MDEEGLTMAKQEQSLTDTGKLEKQSVTTQTTNGKHVASSPQNSNEDVSMENAKDSKPAKLSDAYSDYTVMPESSWPPPIFVKRNATPQERFYLENRWHSQWSYYDSKATENKNTHFLYQRIVVIGSLIIPALVSLNSTIARFLAALINAGDPAAEALWRIVVDSFTVAISLAVAGSAALESLYKYGDNWSSYRAAAEELQSEKNFYDMKAGPYASNPTPFTTFVERVENIIAKQNGSYFQAVQQQLQKQAQSNENLVQSFLTGEDDEAERAEAVTSETSYPAG